MEDVYIIGLSVVNKLEEKRLKKIFKGDTSIEPTTSKEDKIDLFEKNELYETCMELREMIDKLKIRVGSMDRKIDELEDEVSSLKVVVHDLKQREAPAEEDTSSEH